MSGGSAGLGLAIAEQLLRAGYRVTIFGRDIDRLNQAADTLRSNTLQSGAIPNRELQNAQMTERVAAVAGDATDQADVKRLLDEHCSNFKQLDVLVNVVGKSDRGTIARLELDQVRRLFDANVVSTLVMSQVCLPAIREQGGSIVNIGSLASRVTPRYLGGYAIAKHALAALTRQMRLECESDGVHVGLVCPGPIAREGNGNRYEIDAAGDVPQEAAGPGGGAKLRQLTAEQVADCVLKCIRKRQVEVIVPSKTRIVMLLNSLVPSWADRLLSRNSA